MIGETIRPTTYFLFVGVLFDSPGRVIGQIVRRAVVGNTGGGSCDVVDWYAIEGRDSLLVDLGSG